MRSYTFGIDTPLLQPGTYHIIDPCYVLQKDDDNFWTDFCHYAFEDPIGKTSRTTTVEMDGHTIFIFSTAYGDGLYPIFKGGEHLGDAGVDAGVLCLFPDELVGKDESKNIENLGVMVALDTMAKPVVIEGNLTIDNISVITNGDDDEEDDYDYDYEEDE